MIPVAALRLAANLLWALAMGLFVVQMIVFFAIDGGSGSPAAGVLGCCALGTLLMASRTQTLVGRPRVIRQREVVGTVIGIPAASLLYAFIITAPDREPDLLLVALAVLVVWVVVTTILGRRDRAGADGGSGPAGSGRGVGPA